MFKTPHENKIYNSTTKLNTHKISKGKMTQKYKNHKK
jgi:hypothetical protein